MQYYKYTKLEYLEGMLENGKLRIGTLYEYRDIEQRELQDMNEGTAIGATYVSDGTFNSQSELPGVFRNMFNIGNSEVHFENVSAKTGGQVKNAYIYCVTNSLSKELMEHFKCDACIEISNIKRFAEEMVFQLFNDKIANSHIAFVHDCFYEEREIEINNGKDALKIYWLKEPKFSIEQEYRIVIEPKNYDITGFVHDFPALKDCMKVIDL